MDISDKYNIIEEYLEELKELVNLGWMDIDLTRAKNVAFIQKISLA